MSYFDNKDDGVFWISYDDFMRIFGFWSVNKYVDGHQFCHTMMQSNIKTYWQFSKRYLNHEFYLIKMKVSRAGQHTFGVSQYGERLLPRGAQYKYANCIAYLVKAKRGTDSLDGCHFIGKKVTRQDRDTYIECGDLEKGTYFLYVDMEWQPDAFKWLK